MSSGLVSQYLHAFRFLRLRSEVASLVSPLTFTALLPVLERQEITRPPCDWRGEGAATAPLSLQTARGHDSP
jgi:hypothetical protein